MAARSRQCRRSARLFWATGARSGRIERKLMPDHRSDLAVEGSKGRGLRRLNGYAGMQRAAQGAAAPGRAVGAALVVLAGPSPGVAMTDYSRCERVGRGDACGPAGRDRRENLHRQRYQGYGQKVLQPPAHRITIGRSEYSPAESEVEAGFPRIFRMWL